MKMIMAVIKPHRLDDVREALTTLGVEGLTATEASELLGISPAGARMRKKRLLEKLKKRLAGLWP